MQKVMVTNPGIFKVLEKYGEIELPHRPRVKKLDRVERGFQEWKKDFAGFYY